MLELFCCYASADEDHYTTLNKQLAVLRHQRDIEMWHKFAIVPGREWQQEIDHHLNTAHIILLLLSCDFMDSECYYGQEMQRALERHQKGTARVIPIVVRPVYWEGTSIAKLQALPPGSRPVTSWSNPEDAWLETVKGIVKTIQEFKKNRSGQEECGTNTSHSSGKYNIKNDGPTQGQVVGENVYVTMNFGDSQEEHEPPLRSSSNKSHYHRLLGPTVKLVQFAHISEASPDEICQYYAGKPLTWNILAAKGDVQRDLCDELIQNTISLTPRMHMLCLCGEPGSGKSTLAWRIAAEVAEKTQRPLLQVLDNESNTFWDELENIAEQYTVPLVVLVDDIFRSSSAQKTLKAFSPDLPLTFITTSRSNEIPAFPLHFSPEFRKVPPPTQEEKIQVLQKLNLSEKTLEDTEKERLYNANSWLAMMLELTKGKDLLNIIKDSINRLEKQNEIIYQAYKYLCYAGQYDIGIPVTLLDRLEPQGQDIAHHPNSRDLIFIDDRSEVRTQHSTIACQAFMLYQCDPLIVLRNLVKIADASRKEHRVFLLRLLRTLVLSQQEKLVRNLLEQDSIGLTVILSATGSGELLYGWVELYRLLGDRDKELQLKGMVLDRYPETSLDWHAHLKQLERQQGNEQIRVIIDKVASWLVVNFDETDVRARYLGIVARRGSKRQLQKAIKGAEAWLEYPQHFENINVRQAYLRLIKKGTKRQLQKAIKDTGVWLEYPQHFENTNVRQAYLVGVRNPDIEHIQTQEAIKDTQAWLEYPQHFENTNVRQAYLELVEKRGTKEQIQKAIRDIEAWFDEHPENTNVRQAYLRLVKSQGTEEQVRVTIDEIVDQLAMTLKDTNVRMQRLKRIAQQGSQEEKEAAIEETALWLAEHPQDVNTRKIYLGLITQQGTKDQAKVTIDEIVDQLAISREDANVRMQRLKRIAQQGSQEEKEAAIEETALWLSKHPQDVNTRKAYLGLITQQGTKERVQTIIDETMKWLNKYHQEVDVRARCLGLIERQGTEEQRQIAIEETTTWLSNHSYDVNVRQAYLRLVGQRGTSEQAQKAIEDTEVWLAEHSENTTVRQAYLGLIERQGTDEQVQDAIKDTEAWLAEHPENTNLRQAYLGLIEELIERQGTDEQVQEAIKDIEVWLAEHPKNINVRQVYSKLFKRSQEPLHK